MEAPLTVTAETTVRDLALENPAAVRVFDELNIDYCCGGSKPLSEACAKAGISVDALLRHIEQASTRFPASEDRDWNRAPLGELMQHIVNRHHAYLREALPQIGQVTRKVAAAHGERHSEVLNVEHLFRLLVQELEPHMMKEEQVLFPFVGQMEAALEQGQRAPAPFFGTVGNPIRAMVQEHEGAGELLRQLRNVTRDYRLPDDACTTYTALYNALQELEHDLHRHIHLENNILFPRALQMEAAAQVS
jgi:regulator of cell morphogenesis and NO signaling